MKGKIITPEIINRTPAKWNGVSYLSPSLIPAAAVDHKRHATMAQKIVFPLLYNYCSFGIKDQKKIIQLRVIIIEFKFNMMTS